MGHSVRHNALVKTSGDERALTITIECNACEGATVTVPLSHVVHLATALQLICEHAGIDTLAKSILLDLRDEHERAEADEITKRLKQQRLSKS